MYRSSMNVESKLCIWHDKDTDVTHRAQVYKLLHLVLHKTLINEGEKDPLHHTYTAELELGPLTPRM